MSKQSLCNSMCLSFSAAVGMLWTGEKPGAKAIEENMTTYFNTLQGFLLVSHASTVGAGPTLSSSVHASVKQVVDSSFRLMKDTVSSYGSHSGDQKLSVPQLVGAVWEACDALKKTPATNITAIGRAMTQVAVSVKDVLREMKELKPCSSADPVDTAAESCAEATEDEPHDDNLSEGDLGNDLSPEEMKVAEKAVVVVSDTLSVIKELIRSITGLLKLERPNDSGSFVDSLEKLLKKCQELGRQIDEIGACLYPPQEISAIKAATDEISCIIEVVQAELGGLKGSSDAFVEACNALKSSFTQLASEISSSSTADIEAKVENITLSN
ncbi:hypothetical protein PIB30_050028 [Stylosanthes scabra]|uniref:Uncharacterized protein n=1 Tax=Stylosanthes scabra TaxID=79078 RepID=A0ABU6XHR3_9FABA|nr:hypothetical protein [Stylosanthes scabra]